MRKPFYLQQGKNWQVMPTLYSKQRRILKSCSLEQTITVKLVSKIRTNPLSFSSTKLREGAAYNLPHTAIQ